MRKSVILIILVIFIASFFIVGFYGAQMKIYDPNVKVEAIVCHMAIDDEYDIDTSTTAKSSYKNLKNNRGEQISYVFNRLFTPSDVAKGLRVDLKFGVDPPTATNTGIRYIVSQKQTEDSSVDASTSASSRKPKYTFTDNGDGSATFMFNEPFEVEVLIVASDNASNVKTLVKVAVVGSLEYYDLYG